MQGKEDIGSAALNGQLQVSLARDGAFVGQVRAATAGTRRPFPQRLGRRSMKEGVGVCASVQLVSRALVQIAVVGRLDPAALEAQVAQVDALEMTETAVLGEQQRTRGLARDRHGGRQGDGRVAEN